MMRKIAPMATRPVTTAAGDHPACNKPFARAPELPNAAADKIANRNPMRAGKRAIILPTSILYAGNYRNNRAPAGILVGVNRILTWFGNSNRELPWRVLSLEHIDPWAVLISEFMLQQTQVSRVMPRFEMFSERWPTPCAMAQSPLADVLVAWDRLGYPRRAKWLHEASVRICEEFGGVVPSDIETLESFRGIGPYTARAIAVFAYGKHHPVIDTNVRRVLARWLRGEERAAGPLKQDYELLENLLPVDPVATRLLGYAVMELGATVCTARNPVCAECPVAVDCAWRAAGYPAGEAARKEARYEGSDRQARGNALRILRSATAPVPVEEFENISTDADQRQRALESLVVDGLVTVSNGAYSL